MGESSQQFDVDRWVYETKKRDAERAHDIETDFFRQANDAAIQSGTLAVRTALLINGGAAIAVLAFLGGLAGQGRVSSADLDNIAGSLMPFAYGVACAALSAGSAYFTNYTTAGVSASRKRSYEQPYVDDGPTTKKWTRARSVFLGISVLGGLIALGLFIYGMYDVREAIGAMKLADAQKSP